MYMCTCTYIIIRLEMVNDTIPLHQTTMHYISVQTSNTIFNSPLFLLLLLVNAAECMVNRKGLSAPEVKPLYESINHLIMHIHMYVRTYAYFA